jgi:CHASE2 domain-containing sensor protein
MGTKEPGRIITFYSFKGGTGRSMAVANVGYLLASSQYGANNVLLVDWDLEAPGLHRYFKNSFGRQLQRALPSKEYARELNSYPGLIEIFTDYRTLIQNSRFPQETSKSQREAMLRQAREDLFASFDRYVLRTDEDNLGLVKTGKFDAQYPNRIQEFDWRGFHQADPTFFHAFRDFLVEEYDFVLIDSRTGLTDTSGICTQEMPDTLVLVFVPNLQNIEGLLDVVRHVKLYRSGELNQAPLSAYPLASRIDAGNSALRRLWREGGYDGEDYIEGYQPIFEHLLKDVYELDDCKLAHYFDATQVPHDASFSFGEKIAAKSGITEKLSMGAAYANLTKWLTSETAAWESVDQSEPRAQVSETVLRRLWASIQASLDTLLDAARLLIAKPVFSVRLTVYFLCLLAPFLGRFDWQYSRLCKREGSTALWSLQYSTHELLQSLAPRTPVARAVSLVTLRPGREPEEIFFNICRQRLFLASLLTRLQQARPAVIVIDKWFSPGVCPEKDSGTQLLKEAISSSRIPIVIGQQSYGKDDPELAGDSLASRLIQGNSGEACFALAPTLKFSSDSSRVSYGLLRVDSNTSRLPLTWRAYAADQEHQNAERTPLLFPGLAFAAAQALYPNLMADSRIQQLAKSELHPYTSFIEPSKIPSYSATQLLSMSTEGGQSVGRSSSKGQRPEDQLLENRVVIIGEESRNDVHPSAIGEVQGFVLQANYLEALLDRRYSTPAPAAVDVLLVVMAILLIERIFVFSFSRTRGLLLGSFLIGGLWPVAIAVASVWGYIISAWIWAWTALLARYFSSFLGERRSLR